MMKKTVAPRVGSGAVEWPAGAKLAFGEGLYRRSHVRVVGRAVRLERER
jgi:hypothetical protein